MVKEAHRDGDLRDGEIAAPEQLAGFVDAVFGQIVDGALAHVQHEHPVQMAAGDPHALGHIVDGDVVGVVELDVLDGVQHILAGGGAGVRLGGAGLLHQSGDEQVEIPHHGGLVLGLHPPGLVDAVQRLAHPLRVLCVVHRLLIGKGQLGGELVGTRTVEAHPPVLPGLLLVCGIADQLVGPGKEQIPGHQLPGAAPYLEDALAGHHQVDQIVIPDAGAPGVAGRTALQAAVKDGQLDVVGVVLLEGLFVYVRHGPSASCLSGWYRPSIP